MAVLPVVWGRSRASRPLITMRGVWNSSSSWNSELAQAASGCGGVGSLRFRPSVDLQSHTEKRGGGCRPSRSAIFSLPTHEHIVLDFSPKAMIHMRACASLEL